jgi:hypothetical protein
MPWSGRCRDGVRFSGCSGYVLDTAVKHGFSAGFSAVVLAKDDRGTMEPELAITEERAYPLRRSKGRVNAQAFAENSENFTCNQRRRSLDSSSNQPLSAAVPIGGQSALLLSVTILVTAFKGRRIIQGPGGLSNGRRIRSLQGSGVY